jgi:hypothetical protein
LNPAPDMIAATLATLDSLATCAYVACQCALLVYASHRWTMVLGPRRRPPVEPVADTPEAALPYVTVQLPVYDERRVVERLVDAAAALDWPRDRLEVQVLDDSSDETSALAATAVARARAAGVNVVHLRRGSREGYKAGALAAGLAVARGEFVAIFDADFVPPPGTLRRLMPRFADARVGMVQARWGHLNRGRSLLTAAQATLLDAHFLLEHAVRAGRGLFFNFNGTAGIWRRACIEDAGGWSHATLTEDLDLSYRAQLAGWRFAYAPGVVVPAELPSDMAAFKSQQRRWARGSIQTARRVLPGLWRRDLPIAVKFEAFFHLTANAAYPLLLALGLLLLPVLLARPLLPPALVWAMQGGVLLLGAVPVCVFLAAGAHAAGRRGPALVRDTLAALVLGAGVSLNNALAVLAGLGATVGEWERTPKTGECEARAPVVHDAPAPRYAAGPGASGTGEALLALYFACLLVWAAFAGPLRTVPFLAVLAAGFAWVGAAGGGEAKRPAA